MAGEDGEEGCSGRCAHIPDAGLHAERAEAAAATWGDIKVERTLSPNHVFGVFTIPFGKPTVSGIERLATFTSTRWPGCRRWRCFVGVTLLVLASWCSGSERSRSLQNYSCVRVGRSVRS